MRGGSGAAVAGASDIYETFVSEYTWMDEREKRIITRIYMCNIRVHNIIYTQI